MYMTNAESLSTCVMPTLTMVPTALRLSWPPIQAICDVGSIGAVFVAVLRREVSISLVNVGLQLETAERRSRAIREQ